MSSGRNVELLFGRVDVSEVRAGVLNVRVLAIEVSVAGVTPVVGALTDTDVKAGV